MHHSGTTFIQWVQSYPHSIPGQARFLLRSNGRLDTVEEVASCATNLIRENGISFSSLNRIVFSARYMNSRARWQAISHLKTVLEITTPFSWNNALFWKDHDLTLLFHDDRGFEEAQADIDYTPSMKHTPWVVRWKCGLRFGAGNTDLERRDPRLCTLSTSTKS